MEMWHQMQNPISVMATETCYFESIPNANKSVQMWIKNFICPLTVTFIVFQFELFSLCIYKYNK